MNFEDIRGRCREDDSGCLIWAGGTSNGAPKIWAPDFTNAGGARVGQPGRRAVWHVVTGKPIPNGWRVFGTCGNALCLEFKHMVCRHPTEHGKIIADGGTHRGNFKHIIANRAISRARAKLNPELIRLIQHSPMSAPKLALEIGVSKQLVANVRAGRAGLAFQPVGGMFSALMARG